MTTCVRTMPAAHPTWVAALPYAPHSTPLRPSSATWNTKFPAGLSLDLSLPPHPPLPVSAAPKRPALRLPALASSSAPTSHVPAAPTPTHTHTPRFDPFADEPPIASTSTLPNQNTPPRGRPLVPAASPAPSPTPTPPPGRRRAPSFSAGSGSPRSSLSPSASSLLLAPPLPRQPAPQPAPPPAPAPAQAANPSGLPAPPPFHARHYPTPDARARLVARTLLTRIHAVGRPRLRLLACGTEFECGRRPYVRSRLGEVCVVA